MTAFFTDSDSSGGVTLTPKLWLKTRKAYRHTAKMIYKWLNEQPDPYGTASTQEPDPSDRTITLHRRLLTDYRGYPIRVHVSDSYLDIQTDDTEQDIVSPLNVALEMEKLGSSRGISSDDLTDPLWRSVISSRILDHIQAPSGHISWDHRVVMPVLNEALRAFREIADPNPDLCLNWLYLPGDLLQPYVVLGRVLPLDKEHYLGFDLYQSLRPDSRVSSLLTAAALEDDGIYRKQIDHRTVKNLIAVIRPCATEPRSSTPDRILHTLHRLAPTIDAHIRYLWQVKNLCSETYNDVDDNEIWIPVLLYEGSKWYFFVARTTLGKMTAVRIRWSADTSLVVSCKKLLSLLIVLMASARSLTLPWLIENVFRGHEKLDEGWKSEMGSLILPENEIERFKGLLKSLPVGSLRFDCREIRPSTDS